MSMAPRDLIFIAPQLLGACAPQPPDGAPVPVANGTWFIAQKTGDGLFYSFPMGSLVADGGYAYLSADFLLDGTENCVFTLALQEGENGPRFDMRFGFLNACSGRIHIPLAAVNQNQWTYPRRGAFLKPLCDGTRVDLARVDRILLLVQRPGLQAVRFCLSPLTATASDPAELTHPILPKGPLLDQLGQSTLHDWPTKTHSTDEVVARLREQSASASNQKWPLTFTKYGGYNAGPQLQGTGFFRTYREEKEGGRWWLVDPEGYLFWSAGMDCVRPGDDSNLHHLEKALAWLPDRHGSFREAFGQRGDPNAFSYLIANFIRAFGPQTWRDHWAKIALAQLRSFGANTVANWSDWHIARKTGFPYVRPLNLHCAHTPMVYRDFPDVFHHGYQQDATEFAQQLAETRDDPALIGYFLMNEPTWGFAAETAAAGMLFSSPPGCETRKALAEFLRQRHGTNEGLSAAWGVNTTYISLAFNPWTAPLNATAEVDLAVFSTVMVERLFRTLSEACKKVDPNHLNLGARYYTVPPDWALEGMKCFDVFSVNAYTEKIPAAQYLEVAKKVGRPVLAGEWHFGALDVGLPASGIGHVRTQTDRGRAYRVYLEDAAACPACVGVHYFQMYDQSALGRFDGENYNIGFVDITNRPYEELVFAARESHERMYKVARGEEKPYSDAPEYLPKLFM